MIKGTISTPSDRLVSTETAVPVEKRENGDCLIQNHEMESKAGIKSNASEELQPTLDSGKY